MPVGTKAEQELVAIQRTPDGFTQASLGGVRFVPLLGDGGWPE